MHSYFWNSLCPAGSTGFLGSGWVVYAMGFALVILVGVVLWVLLSQRSTQPTGSIPTPMSYAATRPGDAAESIARERFARGEIDRDEYDRLIATLRSS